MMTPTLADAGPVIAIVLLVVIFGGSFLIASMIVKLAQIVTRGLFGSSICDSGRGAPTAGRLVCRNKDCRHGNPPGARFCGRCGRPLRSSRGAEWHG